MQHMVQEAYGVGARMHVCVCVCVRHPTRLSGHRAPQRGEEHARTGTNRHQQQPHERRLTCKVCVWAKSRKK